MAYIYISYLLIKRRLLLFTKIIIIVCENIFQFDITNTNIVRFERIKATFHITWYVCRWFCNFLLFSLTWTFGVQEAEVNRSRGPSRESREADGRTDSAQCEHPSVAVQIQSWVNMGDLWKARCFLVKFQTNIVYFFNPYYCKRFFNICVKGFISFVLYDGWFSLRLLCVDEKLVRSKGNEVHSSNTVTSFLLLEAILFCPCIIVLSSFINMFSSFFEFGEYLNVSFLL